MRWPLAGIILLLLSPRAFSQITGEVESIGFNNSYRPDCITPMIVRLKAPAGVSGKYFIEVKQKDLDADEAVFRRPVSITGSERSEGQRFATWFIPQPTGLSDPMAGGTLKDIQREIKVYLTDPKGKQIATLPITSTIKTLDPRRGTSSDHRGRKMILCVSGNGSLPAWSEYQDDEHLLGMLEDVEFVSIPSSALPENPAAYEAVDAVVWMNVDPADLKIGGDEKFRALQTYVHQGGHLVICQSPQWQQYLGFGDLLPVTLQGMDANQTLEPLRSMARIPKVVYDPKSPGKAIPVDDPWEKPKPPFSIARATAKPGTLVDSWVNWDDAGTDRTPYIVRQISGLGAVTWLAQDLGDPGITSLAKTGWVNIWDRIFDWKDLPIVVDEYTPEITKASWARGGVVDMGPSLVPGFLDFPAAVSSMVALAVAFFIIYWVISGPGLFAFLVHRRRQSLNWFGFTLSAIVATFVTVLIVKLVVRGPPKLAHNSIVSQSAGQPALVRSNFGLYIKQDGPQNIEMRDYLAGSVSTLTALPRHPDNMTGEADATSAIEYQVPVRDVETEDAPALSIYYRNTAKKFNAFWIGQGTGKIDGSARLVQSPRQIDGALTNGTGKRLEDVYIAFKYPGSGFVGGDWMLWIDHWDARVSLDLAREFYMNDKAEPTPLLNVGQGIKPGSSKYGRIRGRIHQEWQADLWNPLLRNANTGKISGDGVVDDLRSAFVMLSLFDRLSPVDNTFEEQNRVEVLRRGGRHLDRSAALAAGAMVILARTVGPMPAPIEVEGDRITSDGPIYYQFVLPIDRAAIDAAAATQPAE